MRCCLPAAKDNSLDLPPRKQLEERSAEAAGTSHPAVFMLLSSPAEELKKAPLMVHDSDKNTWSATLPLDTCGQGTRRAACLSRTAGGRGSRAYLSPGESRPLALGLGLEAVTRTRSEKQSRSRAFSSCFTGR